MADKKNVTRLLDLLRGTKFDGLAESFQKEPDLQALAELEKTFPQAHLAPLWALYRACDGSGECGWMSIDDRIDIVPRWVPAKEAVEHSLRYGTHGPYYDASEPRTPDCVAFGYCEDFVYVTVSLDTGHVIYELPGEADPEDSEVVILAHSLDEWFGKLADKLAGNELVYDPDEDIFNPADDADDAPRDSSPADADDVSHDQIKDAFNRFDRNADGSIDARELAKAAMALGLDVDDEDVEDALERLDRDVDGALSLAEFTAFVKEHL